MLGYVLVVFGIERCVVHWRFGVWYNFPCDLAIIETGLPAEFGDIKSAADDGVAMMNGFGFPGERDLKVLLVGSFFSACILIGQVGSSKALLCLSAAILAFVSFVSTVFRAEEIVALWRILFRVPVWSGLGDFFSTVVCFDCFRGMQVMGEMLSDQFVVGREEGPGISIGVDVPGSGTFRVIAVEADEGPWATISCGIADRAFVLACVLSAKQKVSILRLFLFYSSASLHATKFINVPLKFGGLGRVSVAIAISLVRITMFLRLCISIITV